VAMRNGKPVFQSLRSRVTRHSSKIVYFAFDILYENYEPRMELPLMERKRILESVAGPYVRDGFAINTFTDTHGKLFFEKVKIEGLEGIMAKQKNSLYFPGKREDSWKKIKTRSEMLCVVIGFIPKENEFKSLILASEINGKLRYVGKVGTGFSNKQKNELYNTLRKLTIAEPVVPCPEAGVWIKPEIYCDIAYAELTHDNVLRAPVFKSIVK
jgi:bifunctional non-homologous end joining protein LigD